MIMVHGLDGSGRRVELVVMALSCYPFHGLVPCTTCCFFRGRGNKEIDLLSGLFTQCVKLETVLKAVILVMMG